jgi:tRNA(Ile)-lysidine synthase
LALNPQQILVELNRLAAGRRFCLAYSGGIDSHVLLHILANATPTLSEFRVVHINHGLSPDAASWTEHCSQVCQALGVAFKAITVTVSDIDTQGMEAAARQARYQAFKTDLDDDEVLLTAQHQQDQAETLMLQLLRGAGPKGLSAMWPETSNYGLTILRPLLTVSKQEIRKYAELHQLEWVEDPSNDDARIKRNYLRQRIWPELQEQWPALDRILSRSAEHCRDATILLDELAEIDAKRVCPEAGQLSLSVLLDLSLERQRNLLRNVIEKQGLTLPSTVIIQRIINEVCHAAIDKVPEVRWPGAIVRRYRDTVYIQAEKIAESISAELQLSEMTELNLSSELTLVWQKTTGQGLKASSIQQGLSLRYRVGGEQIRLQGHRNHKSLKTLFQEWAVPPWQRKQVPLLFAGDELVAVVGYGYAEGYAVNTDEQGWLPSVIKRN